MRLVLCCLVAGALAGPSAAQSPAWSGTWFTNEGVLSLRQDQGAVEGTLGEGNARRTLEGTASGKALSFRWRAGNREGEGEAQLDASGHGFTGRLAAGGREWRGWRQDPKATQGQPAKVHGYWRTSWGMLQLEQKGNAVHGILGAAGWTGVKGEVRGRRMTLQYRGPFGTGEIWAELRDGGKAAFGAAESERGKWSLIAQRLEGHARDVKPKPGQIVDAIGSNRLTYHVRVPPSWKPGSTWPAVVILHGSNYASRPYLDTIAGRNGIGERFVVIGIDGEQWVHDSPPDDPRHNYTYVNWMGKSTYEGYPNTERESPALVADLIRELKQKLRLGKVFVGGHSQGGFLAWFFPMHFPDLVDGVFPIAAGLVIQNEPDVFQGDELLAAQRRVPVAVVHGEHDEAVPFAQGRDSYERLIEFGFPAARLFAAKAPHAFVALPWADAIAWLEASSSDDPAALLAFAEAQGEGRERDACAAVLRARTMKLTPELEQRAAAVMARIDAAAGPAAARIAQAMAGAGDAPWIDEFLAFRERFAFADAAREVMAGFAALRAQHEPKARELYRAARAAFQAGRRDEGWAKYEQLAAECFASTHYARVKRWLAER